MFNLFEIKTQEKNIALVKKYDNTIPEILLCDPARLHLILINLINNAIKFTIKGEIIVSVHLLDKNDEKAIIQYFPKPNQKKITDITATCRDTIL